MRIVSLTNRIFACILAVCIAAAALPIAGAAGERTGYAFSSAQKNCIPLLRVIEKIPSTIEAWVKLEPDQNKRQLIMGNYTGSANCFSLELSADNQLRYYEMNGKTSAISLFTSGAQICTGAWTHIAVIRDAANNQVIFWQDGKVISTQTVDGLNAAEETKLTTLHSIGSDSRKQMFLDGRISRVSLWDKLLTTDELNAIADADIKGTEENLMHCWNLTPDMTGLSDQKPGGISGFVEEGLGEYKSPFQGSGSGFSAERQFALADVTSTVPQTMEAWVKIPVEVTDRAGVIVGNYGEGSYADIPNMSFEVYSNGNPRLYADTPDGQLNFVVPVDARKGNWVHLAMTYSAETGEIRCYFNGELAGEGKTQLQITPGIIPFRIGGDCRSGNGRYFQGELADVRLWSTVRTKEEIKANMLTPPAADAEGLLGCWALETEEHGIYRDSSAQKNDAYAYSDWLEFEEVNIPEGDYSIAVIPDTQNLSEFYPDKLNQTMTWLKDNQEKYKIGLAIQVGDIVNSDQTQQWQNAQAGYSILDESFPYVFAPGNHDMYGQNSDGSRKTESFNQYFPYSKYSKDPSFGGAMEEGKMDNTYHLFDLGDTKFLVLMLQFAPTDAVLDWANQVVEKYPDRKVIMATHAYMYHNGNRQDTDSIDNARKYYADGNTGEDMWKKLISRHQNMALVLSGHIGNPNLVMRTDTGKYGNRVPQVLCDAQFMDSGYEGLGMVMLMTFHNGSDTVDVNYYSPTEGKFFRIKNQFQMEMDLHKELPEPQLIQISEPENSGLGQLTTVSCDDRFAGNYLTTQVTIGSGGTAKVMLTTVQIPQDGIVTVSYPQAASAIDVWVTEKIPSFTGGVTTSKILASASQRKGGGV